MKPVRIKIIAQGAPLVNDAFEYRSGPGIAAIIVDLKSKRCAVTGISGGDYGPEIYIDALEGESLHLGDEPGSTMISFPRYRGWEVFCADISKCTLSVCLIEESNG